ncbi:MAG: aminotransferase class IV [Dehalococcoidia bacterium]|nr:MAG: aminotransferase class IV [Dehalococcoidia bacterium]
MEQIVYLNGALLPRGRAKISPFDHGFLYGYALFETMRAYSGCIFRFQKHLDRLTCSAELIGLPLGTFDLEKACYDTLRANSLGDARIRLTVSIGEGGNAPDPPPRPRPTVFIVATSYTPPSAEKYRNGFKAVVSSIRQNSQSPLSRLKSANYLSSVLARKEAKAAGADEALLLNERGFLCEGSTSNVFLVTANGLITPDEESGCLPGVTRQAVIELASELGISVAQREVQIEELLQADEAFVTNSLLELMPLGEVDGKPIGGEREKGERDKVTERLMIGYEELVARGTKSLP